MLVTMQIIESSRVEYQQHQEVQRCLDKSEVAYQQGQEVGRCLYGGVGWTANAALAALLP